MWGSAEWVANADNATISHDAHLYNFGTIGSATLYNSYLNNYGNVNSATLNGFGWLMNHIDTGTVDSVTLNDIAVLYSYDGSGKINTVEVNASACALNQGGTFGTVTLNSGLYEGYGDVETFNFNGGILKVWSFYQDIPSLGTIGTLNVGAEAILTDLNGTIDYLNFAEGGRLLYSGNWWDTTETGGFRVPDDYLHIGDANFANATIQFDLETDPDSVIPSYLKFDFAKLFNADADVSWLATIDASNIVVSQCGNVLESYQFRSLGDGVFALGEEANAATPEPATLLVIGLELTGLGIVRRRKK